MKTMQFENNIRQILYYYPYCLKY